MGLEIERKFLVQQALWAPNVVGERLIQGYIAANGQQLSVRVRIVAEQAWLNIKGRINDISRHEYEYEIPIKDAQELLMNFAGNIVDKLRYKVEHKGHVWEVDEFLGENKGLLVAELELSSEGEQFAKPPWLGQEVSSDPRYLNTSLAKHPFSQW